MAYLEVEYQDGSIRVKTEEWNFELADTKSNKKSCMVWLRGLRSPKNGKVLYTYQEIAEAFGYSDRRNVNNYWREFEACDKDMLNFLVRKRKVDRTVVEAVGEELKGNLQCSLSHLCTQVNDRLGRSDLTPANIRTALAEVPCTLIRKEVVSQWEAGEFHPKERVILEEAMAALEENLPEKKQRALRLLSDLNLEAYEFEEDKVVKENHRQAVSDLLNPNLSPDRISGSIRLIALMMTLYYWNVPLSRIGIWFGKSKSTVWGWVTGLSVALFTVISELVLVRVKATQIYIDEKWLKIKGRWHYWFVALDSETGLPILGHLMPSQTKWACRWFLVMMKRDGIYPDIIITDGLAGYVSAIGLVFINTKHLLCLFHHQQGVTRWIKTHLLPSVSPEESEKIKKKMKKVAQTRDPRTAIRRLQRLEKEDSEKGWGIAPWITMVWNKLGRLIPAMRNNKYPRTTNEIERFFRSFQRFYKTRNGFHSVRSARQQLMVFTVIYLFTCQAKSGKAPIERIMPEAKRMPLYQILNDPIPWIISIEHLSIEPVQDEELATITLEKAA